MAGRGPAPNDPATRQRRNTPRALELVAEAAEVSKALPVKPPPPPAGLLKPTRDRWDRFWSSRVAAIVDRTSDMAALERLFLLYDDADRYRKSILANPMVTGSQGQMVRNPFVKDLKDTNTEIRALEDRFGLSPRARASLNLTLGVTAKTLADLNADFVGVGGGADGDDDGDPRHDVIDGELADGGPASEFSA